MLTYYIFKCLRKCLSLVFYEIIQYLRHSYFSNHFRVPDLHFDLVVPCMIILIFRLLISKMARIKNEYSPAL